MPECWPCSDPASPWRCGVPGVLRFGRIGSKRAGRWGRVPTFETEIRACPGCHRYATDEGAREAFEREQGEKKP